MKMNELDAKTITYHGKNYRVWSLDIGDYEVEIGEADLEREIIGWDCDPVDEEGFNLDERIGYYAEPTDDVDDVIRAYLN